MPADPPKYGKAFGTSYRLRSGYIKGHPAIAVEVINAGGAWCWELWRGVREEGYHKRRDRIFDQLNKAELSIQACLLDERGLEIALKELTAKIAAEVGDEV